MGALAEFVRKEAAHLKNEEKRRSELLGEWLASVGRLFTELEEWVREADAGMGLLGARRLNGPLRQELLLGVYDAPLLRISLGGELSGRGADVVARARHVASTIRLPEGGERRADGMVEIRDGRIATDYLFRVAGAGGEPDRWFIRDVDGWNADPEYGKVEPLTRERFETAVLRALK